MRAPYEVRQNWRMARKLRRAKRRLERALWTRDTGYGRGRRFHGPRFERVYNNASAMMGTLEAEARCLTLEANLECH